MKETKDNNQKLFKIRVFKDFEFPSFSIEKDNTMQDLYNKSMEELRENYNNNNNYFEYELVQVTPFVLRKEPENLSVNWNNNFNFFIRELAINELEEKYGKIDYKTNPDIFDKRTRNHGNGVDQDSPYHLKAEIEDFFSNRVNHYVNLFENKLIRNNGGN